MAKHISNKIQSPSSIVVPASPAPVAEPTYAAEMTNKDIILRGGGEEVMIPREYFRSIYEAMLEAIVLKDGEAKIKVLEKHVPGTEEPAKKGAFWKHFGSKEWYDSYTKGIQGSIPKM